MRNGTIQQANKVAQCVVPFFIIFQLDARPRAPFLFLFPIKYKNHFTYQRTDGRIQIGLLAGQNDIVRNAKIHR